MSDKILKLSQAQTLYQDLRERIDALPTDNDIPEVPVQDVQIDEMSILSNGVANIPYGSANGPGVVSIGSDYGIARLNTSGPRIVISKASEAQIKAGTQEYRPIVSLNQHISVFYGLAKAAGDTTQSVSTNAVGIYTDTAKQKIQNMLGITSLLSTEEAATATAAHAANSLFLMGGKLYKATSAIAVGDAVEAGTNCQIVKADEVFVKNTDLATSTTAGLVKILNGFGIHMSSGWATIYKANHGDIIAPTSSNGQYRPIVPANQHEAVFYGLATAAGDTTQLASDNAVGAYTTTAANAIKTMLQVQEGLEVVRLI